MPALARPKHEQFAQAYVRGEHAGDATACLRAVYGRRHSGHACVLRHRPDVARRIAELQAELTTLDEQSTTRAMERLSITKETVLAELARIAFANMLDYMRIDAATGLVDVDLSRLDRDRAAAMQEILVDYADTKDETQRVKRVRFKLADKHSALVDLGKHFGLFVARRAPDHAERSDADLVARLTDLIGRLADLGVDLRPDPGAPQRDADDRRGDRAAPRPHAA